MTLSRLAEASRLALGGTSSHKQPQNTPGLYYLSSNRRSPLAHSGVFVSPVFMLTIQISSQVTVGQEFPISECTVMFSHELKRIKTFLLETFGFPSD